MGYDKFLKEIYYLIVFLEEQIYYGLQYVLLADEKDSHGWLNVNENIHYVVWDVGDSEKEYWQAHSLSLSRIRLNTRIHTIAREHTHTHTYAHTLTHIYTGVG